VVCWPRAILEKGFWRFCRKLVCHSPSLSSQRSGGGFSGVWGKFWEDQGSRLVPSKEVSLENAVVERVNVV
jgi:hypothetical protein